MVALLYSFFCACEQGAEQSDIPNVDCIEQLGQIQRFAIQRTKDAGTTNSFDIATENPNLLASWTAKIALTNNEKIQVTPTLADFENEPGDVREDGGGNASLGGIADIVGINPTVVTGKFFKVPQKIIKALKTYQCEVGSSVFLFTESGRIVGLADDPENPTTFRGIPITAFFVKDKKMGGFDARDNNEFGWKFNQNWSDDLYLVTPVDFNPVLDLQN